MHVKQTAVLLRAENSYTPRLTTKLSTAVLLLGWLAPFAFLFPLKTAYLLAHTRFLIFFFLF
jgi:hypothetical protein